MGRVSVFGDGGPKIYNIDPCIHFQHGGRLKRSFLFIRQEGWNMDGKDREEKGHDRARPGKTTADLVRYVGNTPECNRTGFTG